MEALDGKRIKTGKLRQGLILLAVVTLSLCFTTSSDYVEKPTAVQGVMDLRDWDIDSAPIRLIGQWEFYPGVFLDPDDTPDRRSAMLLDVPGVWKPEEAGGPGQKGAGTYRLRILMPEYGKTLGIKATTVSTAFKLFADKSFIGEAGKPGLSSKDSTPAYKPAVYTLNEDGDKELELMVHISNYVYRAGGLWHPFELGSLDRLLRTRSLRFIFAIGIAAGFITMAIHAFILYYFRRKEKSHALYGWFCLVIALRTLVTSEYALVAVFPSIPFSLLIRLEYISAFFSMPLALLFFTSLFYRNICDTVTKVIILLHIPFILLIPVAPLPVLTGSIMYYYVLYTATLALISFKVLERTIRYRTQDALTLCIAGIIVAAAAINDMILAAYNTNSIFLVPYALGVLGFAQYLVISRRFTASFSKVEQLSVELGNTNALLHKELEAHKKAQSNLESLLAEKDTHLKEIHHRVKNSLQIVSSMAALQSHRAENFREASALESLRERIRSISLVHEMLYESPTGGLIELRQYIQELIRRLSSGFGATSKVKLDFPDQPIMIPMDFCVDLGLITAELAANSFKHAFINQDSGKLQLRFSLEASILTILISDNGPGFPDTFSPENSNSLGFKIVLSLLRKRKGSMVLDSDNGAGIHLSIPLEIMD